MTPMLEKIARAIAESYYAADYDAEEAKAWAAKDWEDWFPEARAALLAMREPDEAMVMAGAECVWDEPGRWHDKPPPTEQGEARNAFTAMIDAILKEGGE